MPYGTKKTFQRTTFATNAYQTNNRNVIPATFQPDVFQKDLRNFQESVFDVTGVFSGNAKSTFQAHEINMVVFHDGVFDTEVFQSTAGKSWVQAIYETIASSESVASTLGLIRAISETINSTDFRGTGRAIARSISNAVNISLSSLKIRGRGAVINDSIGITEGISRAKAILTRIINETINITSTNYRSKLISRVYSATVGITLSSDRSRVLGRAISDIVNVDDFRGTGRLIRRIISEVSNIGDTFNMYRDRFVTTSDTVNMTDVISRAKSINRMISDSIGMTVTNNITRGLNKAVQLTVNIADFRGTGRALIRSIVETIHVGIGLFQGSVFGKTVFYINFPTTVMSKNRMVSDSVKIKNITTIPRVNIPMDVYHTKS